MIPYPSYISTPPGFTLLSNLASEGWFRMIAVSYLLRIGEEMRSSLMMTVTLAVPPRCSGPYAGIHVTSLFSISPE